MQDVGIGIRRVRHLKLHAKILLADKSRAIVGSINLTPGSFDVRRELAIRVKEHDVVSRLSSIVHEDWKHGHPLDLSEAAVVSDLEKHARAGSLSPAGSASMSQGE
ncbi:MAG TPA: phospholipase D-like domain-containing protein [Bryobacteraceae bacterium]